MNGDSDGCMCEAYAAVTEAAALASARWLGRGDVEGAEEAATTAMHAGLDRLQIEGRIVVGGDEGELAIGMTVGHGGNPVDLAVDPLEGRAVVARGDYGAMAMVAVGDSGSFPQLPQMYMRKMAVGPVARGRIGLDRPIGDNVRAIADAFGRKPNDITAIVLDRPRHHDLIEEIRSAGARIKLIQDGDVTASITAAIRGTNDHLAIGIGGARQAVLSAAALRCLGGELQAQLWPTTRGESAQAVATQLDEVVTIGYGTTTKRDATGAMVNLTADELKTDAVPTVTLTSALQGKAAGVQVVSNTGMPGGGLRVRVRGTGSITANSEPLYVIDGLPAVQGTAESDPKVNPLMSVDPNEIESVEILKDASATAIYGARGANGVVLITTKRGQRGESRLSLETSYGQQRISKTIPVLDAREFMRFVNEARVNANRTPAIIYDSARIANAQTYDYPGMMLRTAPQATHALSLSGGDLRMRYLLSGNYTQQDGIEIGSDFKRYGIRLNVDSDVNTRFRVGTSMSLTRVERNASAVENGALGNSANGIQAALQFDPSLPPRDSVGNWVKSAATSEPTPNPVANATELIDLNTTSRLLGNGYAELDITPSVRLRTTLGGNFQFDKINFFAPRTIQPGGPGGSGWVFSGEIRDLTNENTVNYRRDALGPGSLDLLGGFSVQTFHSDNVRGNAANFPTDATTIFALGTGSQLQAPESGITEAALILEEINRSGGTRGETVAQGECGADAGVHLQQRAQRRFCLVHGTHEEDPPGRPAVTCSSFHASLRLHLDGPSSRPSRNGTAVRP